MASATDSHLCLETLGFSKDHLACLGVDEIRPYLSYATILKEMGNQVDTASWRLARLYQSNTANYDLELEPLNFLKELEVLGSIEQPVSIEVPSVSSAAGRALICSCYKRAYVNATVRKKGDKDVTGLKPHVHTTSPKFTLSRSHDGYDCQYTPLTLKDKFYYSIADTCQQIWEKIGDFHGLTVVAGGTGSGKSQVVRGLIFQFLNDSLAKLKDDDKRDSSKRTHLLTIENPIEAYLFENGKSTPIDPNILASEFGLDYTPRQIPEDTPTLEQALMRDALRQTPNLVYVGEIREPHEFRTVLEFVETGHHVITTMHAGSLREAFQRLLNAAGAETPAARAQIASRIGSIIHLQPLKSKIEEGGSKKKLALPAIWKSTSTGVSNLVADGLSSLVPNEYIDGAYCFGRSAFLESRPGINMDDYNTALTEARKMDMGRSSHDH